MNLFKFWDKYGKEFKCPNTKGKYDIINLFRNLDKYGNELRCKI